MGNSKSAIGKQLWAMADICNLPSLSISPKNKNQVCMQFTGTVVYWLARTLFVMVLGIFDSTRSIKFGSLEANSLMLSILISCLLFPFRCVSLSVTQSPVLSVSQSHCYDWGVMFLSQQSWCSIDVMPTLLVLLFYIMSVSVWIALLLLTIWQNGSLTLRFQIKMLI